jgi:hypothetical protein
VRYRPFRTWTDRGEYLIADTATGRLWRGKDGRVWRGGVLAAYFRSCWLEVRDGLR